MSKKIILLKIITSLVIIVLALFLGFEIGKRNNNIISTNQTITDNQSIKDSTSDTFIDEENREKKNPIDIEFDKAMSKWSGNTGEGVDIICTYGDKWKEEMGKYYILLYDELDNDKKKWLISSQEKWEIYSKENEELGYQIYEQIYQGGSIIQILSADIYYNKYRDRALDLKEKYENITNNR